VLIAVAPVHKLSNITWWTTCRGPPRQVVVHHDKWWNTILIFLEEMKKWNEGRYYQNVFVASISTAHRHNMLTIYRMYQKHVWAICIIDSICKTLQTSNSLALYFVCLYAWFCLKWQRPSSAFFVSSNKRVLRKLISLFEYRHEETIIRLCSTLNYSIIEWLKHLSSIKSDD